jgi:hypothetical protein
MPITTATRHATSGRGRGPVTEPARAVGGAQQLTLRWLAGRRRIISVALAAVGWVAIFTAAIADSGHLGHVAAAQIGFSATTIIFAMGQALLSPALPVIIDDRTQPAAAGCRKRPGTSAFAVGCLLALTAGGAALGADWRTSLLTTLAVACALASIEAQRPGRPPAPGISRIPQQAHPVADRGPKRASPAIKTGLPPSLTSRVHDCC